MARDPRLLRRPLAISVPVPTQRYWGLEKKITDVLQDVRKQALAAFDAAEASA